MDEGTLRLLAYAGAGASALLFLLAGALMESSKHRSYDGESNGAFRLGFGIECAVAGAVILALAMWSLS